MRELLQLAISTGRDHRVTPHGLERADIIEYLNVDQLVPNATSWQELRAERSRLRATKKNTAKDLKKLLEISHGADFSEHSLRRSVMAADEIPGDLLRLFKAITARST